MGMVAWHGNGRLACAYDSGHKDSIRIYLHVPNPLVEESFAASLQLNGGEGHPALARQRVKKWTQNSILA